MSHPSNFHAFQSNPTPYTANPSYPPNPDQRVPAIFQTANQNQGQFRQWTAQSSWPTPPPSFTAQPSTLAPSSFSSALNPSYQTSPSLASPAPNYNYSASSQHPSPSSFSSAPNSYPPVPSFAPPPPNYNYSASSKYPSPSSFSSAPNSYPPVPSFAPPPSYNYAASSQLLPHSALYPNSVPSYPIMSYPSASGSTFASTPPAILSSISTPSAPYPLQQALSTTPDPVALLQLLNPNFDIQDEASRKEVNNWLGFPPNHRIMSEDIKIIQQKIIYADLRPDQQCAARQAFYQSLYPLLTSKPIELPFKDSFGNTIEISLFNDKNGSAIELFFFNEKSSSGAYKFFIYKNGESIYAIWAGNSTNGSILGKLDITRGTINQRPDFAGDVSENYQKHSNACFNLIMQNHEKIRSSLSQDPSEKDKRARDLFQTCVSFLNALAEKKHPIQILANSDIEMEPGSAPPFFWNPVSNASDSKFTWEVQEQKSGGISFSSKKQAGCRGFHSTASRSVTLSTTGNPNEFKVTIAKDDSYDVSHSGTTSEYLCGRNQLGQIVVTGINKQSTSVCEALLSGTPDFRSSSSSMPTEYDLKADVKFVMETLENIAELVSSPHTVFLRFSPHTPRFTLQGTIIPPYRFAHFANRCVNSKGGIPYYIKTKTCYAVDQLYDKKK